MGSPGIAISGPFETNNEKKVTTTPIIDTTTPIKSSAHTARIECESLRSFLSFPVGMSLKSLRSRVMETSDCGAAYGLFCMVWIKLESAASIRPADPRRHLGQIKFAQFGMQ